MNSSILRNPVTLIVIAILVVLLLGRTLAIVPETSQAVIVRFGKVVGVYNPYRANQVFGQTEAGLKVRLPVDQIIWVDKRIQAITISDQQVLSTDQRRLQVDAYARYRIVDPRRMYVSAGNEEGVKSALEPNLSSALRAELGKRSFDSLLSPERLGVMANIRSSLNRIASQYGAQILDVRIMRADLPEGAPLQSAFQRMKSARQQEAATIRAEGSKKGQIIMAEADAEAARIYAASFGKDPAFYDFYRAMKSYRTSFSPKDGRETTMVLSADNDYLRQFKGR